MREFLCVFRLLGVESVHLKFDMYQRLVAPLPMTYPKDALDVHLLALSAGDFA